MDSTRIILCLLVVFYTVNSLPLPESLEVADEDYPDYRLGDRYDEYPVSIFFCFASKGKKLFAFNKLVAVY